MLGCYAEIRIKQLDGMNVDCSQFKEFGRKYPTSSSEQDHTKSSCSVAFILVNMILNQQRPMHVPSFANRINLRCLYI